MHEFLPVSLFASYFLLSVCGAISVTINLPICLSFWVCQYVYIYLLVRLVMSFEFLLIISNITCVISLSVIPPNISFCFSLYACLSLPVSVCLSVSVYYFIFLPLPDPNKPRHECTPLAGEGKRQEMVQGLWLMLLSRLASSSGRALHLLPLALGSPWIHKTAT